MTTSDQQPVTCLNCGAAIGSDAYCSKCGQDNRERRLTVRRIARHIVEDVIELEQPLLRTMVNLSWRPGWVAGEYVRGRRRQFSNPLKYCLIMAAMAVLLLRLMDVDVAASQSGVMPTSDDPEKQAFIDAYVKAAVFFVEYSGLLIAVTLPLIAGLMRLALWRSRHNLVEHYVMAMYAYGQVFLFQAVMIPFEGYAVPGLNVIYNLLPLIWYIVAALQFCEGRWWYILLMSILAHAVYLIVLTALVVAAGIAYVLWFAPAVAGGGVS